MASWAQTRIAFCREPHGERHPCPGHALRVTQHDHTDQVVVAVDGIELVMDPGVFAVFQAMVGAV
jgi:hypothetical protein